MKIEIYREPGLFATTPGWRWRMIGDEGLTIARSGRTHLDDIGLAADMSVALRGRLVKTEFSLKSYFIGNDGVRIEVTVDDR